MYLLQCIEKTDKSYLVAVDAGESMQCGGVSGSESISPLMASAAVAMTFLQSEPNCEMVGMGGVLESLDVRSTSSLTEVCTAVSRVCFLSSTASI